MEQSTIVRFHFLAFYPDVEPFVGGDREVQLRIGHSIELEVQTDSDLINAMLTAVDTDVAINNTIRDALHTRQFRFYPLADGVTTSSCSGEPGQHFEVRWVIDRYFQTVERVTPLHRPYSISIRELDRLVELGYLEGNTRELLVLIDWGLGGGEAFFDIANWLLAHSVDIGIGFVGERVLDRIVAAIAGKFRGASRDRRARMLASLWERNNLYHPPDLREFVECREWWDVDELAKRLALGPASARQLLRSLGFEPNSSGRWRRTDRWRARRRLRSWLRDEDDQATWAEFVPEDAEY